MTIVVYEDEFVNRLAPLTTARPSCCVTMGSYHLLDLLQMLEQPLRTSVREHLRARCELEYPNIKSLAAPADSAGDQGPCLLVNARTVPSISNLATLRRLLVDLDTAAGPVVVRAESGEPAAIAKPGFTWEQLATADSAPHGIPELISGMPEVQNLATTASEHQLQLCSYPHDVVAANMQVIRDNLEHRLASEAYTQTTDGVFMAPDAKLGEFVITDASDGPIVIDEGASVGPYTLLRGPIYIGKRCRILEHAAIKDEVSLGHTTKIGGEVEAAVVEPYTNKQHHGFLGHSYLGSWINLGAGTCNSDLKNTYGAVNMEYPAGKIATGMQFLGCVMGDYSKTAINTGIFTGKVIGVCSMMYGFVTSNVPSFVNYARLFGQLATLPPEVMIATQKRMFSRRKVEQRDCDIQLLHDMYRLTQHERDRFGDEIAF